MSDKEKHKISESYICGMASRIESYRKNIRLGETQIKASEEELSRKMKEVEKMKDRVREEEEHLAGCMADLRAHIEGGEW